MQTRSTRFPLHVYTAYNGYEWQGLENNPSLRNGLERLLDATGVRDDLPDPNAAPTPSTPIGGVLSGKLAGATGIAIWRVHVRRAGDIQHRDSRYIAVLFLPDDGVDLSAVAFDRLWDAPLLRIPKSGPVGDLSIDLADPGCPCLDSPLPSPASLPGNWLRTDVSKSPLSLAEISSEFRSRRRDFGMLVATVYPARDGSIPRVSLRFTPFKEVTDAAALAPRLERASDSSYGAFSLEKDAASASKALSALAAAHPSSVILSRYAADFATLVRTATQLHRPAPAFSAQPTPTPAPPPSPQYTPSPYPQPVSRHTDSIKTTMPAQQPSGNASALRASQSGYPARDYVPPAPPPPPPRSFGETVLTFSFVAVAMLTCLLIGFSFGHGNFFTGAPGQSGQYEKLRADYENLKTQNEELGRKHKTLSDAHELLKQQYSELQNRIAPSAKEDNAPSTNTDNSSDPTPSVPPHP